MAFRPILCWTAENSPPSVGAYAPQPDASVGAHASTVSRLSALYPRPEEQGFAAGSVTGRLLDRQTTEDLSKHTLDCLIGLGKPNQSFLGNRIPAFKRRKPTFKRRKPGFDAGQPMAESADGRQRRLRIPCFSKSGTGQRQPSLHSSMTQI